MAVRLRRLVLTRPTAANNGPKGRDQSTVSAGSERHTDAHTMVSLSNFARGVAGRDRTTRGKRHPERTNMKDCPKCRMAVALHDNFCFQCGFSFGAERSEVLQGCPPSASGSERPIAVEQERAKSGSESPSNQLADASGRSARPSVRAVLEKWRQRATEARQLEQQYRREDRIGHSHICGCAADVYQACADDIAIALADAPPRSGGASGRAERLRYPTVCGSDQRMVTTRRT